MKTLFVLLILSTLTGMLAAAEIHEAVERGDVAVVRKLVSQDGAVIRQKDKAGNLPLHLAAWKGYVEIMEVLLKAGAEVNAKGFDDMTPLHYAAKINSEDACSLLLENGADRNAVNWLSQTPAKLAKTWVARVIQTFSPKIEGAESLFAALAAKDVPKVKSLITSSPAFLSAQNNRGLTALLLAAKNDDLPLMKFLLEAGADVNARDRDGQSALAYACENANIDAVHLLLRFKIRPAAPTEFNELLNKCVVYASWSGFKKIYEKFPAVSAAITNAAKTPVFESPTTPGQIPELPRPATFDFSSLQRPFDPVSLSMQDLSSWSPNLLKPGAISQLHLPPEMRPRHLEIIKLLVESGADVNHSTTNGSALAFSMLSDTPDVVQTLLKQGAKVDLPQMQAPQALAWGAMLDQRDNVRVLLEAGADPLFRAGETPSALAIACKRGLYQMVETLLAAIKDRSRLTTNNEPLKAAVDAGHDAIIRLLLAAGMSVNIRGKHDVTLLHDAVRRDSVTVVQILLEAGAEVNATDKAGYTPPA